MKVAIMTWFSHMNYGTFLQATALLQKLESYGHEVRIIQYYPRDIEPLLPDNNMFIEFAGKAIKKLKNRGVKNIISEINGDIFNDYSLKYFKFTDECETLSDLQKLNAEYDCFICGSDQIWSPLSFDSHYFLDFVKDNNKKIAYAPSIGVSEIKRTVFLSAFEKLLEDFEMVSTREESGSKILSSVKNKEIPVVLDPTLLFDKEHWAKLFNLKKKNEKYLLAYFLGNNEKHIKTAESISKKLNLKFKLIPVFQNDLSRRGAISSVGPEEFVDLIYNAEYVCTDSFHGVAFSVNFEKNFTCFERFKKHDKENQNTRIYNILEKLNLQSRLLQNCEKENIEYTAVNVRLDCLRKQSEKFLLSSIDNAEKHFEKQADMKSVADNSLCCGCGVCKEVCPVNAIKIEMNPDGFYYAAVNNSICVSCGKCKEICPFVAENKDTSVNESRIYSYKDYESSVLLKSSSGGLAYRISKTFSDRGYSIAGCVFDSAEKKAKHILAQPRDMETLDRFSGSKYMQSSFAPVVSQLVLCQTPLVVIGTPCYIAGARNVLKNKADVVFVDLICHGVPSYNLFTKYDLLIQNKYKINTNNLEVSFRYKPMGWRERYLCFSSNDKKLVQHKDKNEYFLMFDSKYCYSKACYECRWRSRSAADLRIGDYWGEKFFSDNTGVSMVLALNETGIKVLEEITPFGRLQQENISDYLEYQQTKNISPTIYYDSVIAELSDPEIPLELTFNKYLAPFEKRKQVKKRIREIVEKFIR